MENSEKRLIQARTAWKSGRLGNGRILEWKPFLVGFRLEFDGVADVVIAKSVKKIPTIQMYSRFGQPFVLLLVFQNPIP